METPRIIELLNEIETNFPVAQWEIQGLRIWPVVRIKLAWELTTRHMAPEARVHSSASALPDFLRSLQGKIQDVARYAATRIRDAAHHSPLRGPVDVLFFGDGISRIQLQGSWYDKLCDPFIDQFQSRGMSCFHLEPNHYYFVPRYRPSLFVGLHLNALRVKAVLSRSAGPLKTDTVVRYDEFLRLLTDRNVEDSGLSLEAIARRIRTLRVLSAYFRKRLTSLRPSLCFLVDYPSLEGMAFCLACRDQDIPSVVIQHGVQGDYNEAYGRWLNIPKNGYELLPSIFWCWSEEDAQKINSWSAPAFPLHQGFAGGNLFLNGWREGTLPFASTYRGAFLGVKAGHPGTTHILVTLQYGFTSEKHLRHLLTAIQHAPAAWTWWIRLHPMMTHGKAKIESLLKQYHITNYEIEHATSLPLYAILPSVDVHVTLHSAVVVEAESFGVPSVIVSEAGIIHFPSQLSTGSAVTAFDPEAIIVAVKRLSSSGQHTSERSSSGAGRPQDKIDELLLIAADIRSKLARIR